MSEPGADEGMRGRGEDALGDLANALLDNPVFNQAIAAAFGAGERAAQAQRAAMGALNLPSASDVERLERRVRSVSDRLEKIEDAIDELRSRLSDEPPISTDQASLKVEE